MATETKYAGTVTDEGSGVSAWLLPSNAAGAANGTTANLLNSIEQNNVSNILFGTDYGFTLPDTATVNGITVNVYSASGTTLITVSSVQLYSGSSPMGDAVSGGTLSTDNPFGGSTDLWGISSLTGADIKTPSIGVAIQLVNTDGMSEWVDIDAMGITVHYTAAAATTARGSLRSRERAFGRAR